MPDALKQTISATQAPALWNVSPWLTRWMLWKHFADGMEIDTPADARMSWGKKLQPLVLEQVAADLALEVRPNEAETYIRRGQLGCTRDAEIIIPDQGPVALETKCVFDYGTWMRDWQGGAKVPRHYEIQLQVQMLVGDGTEPFDQGKIATWVCGDMYYFDREPIPDLWAGLETEARVFFEAVVARAEPEPFGAPVETPFLLALDRERKQLDLSDRDDAVKIAERVRTYAWERGQISAGTKNVDALKAQLLALMGDAEEVVCYGGIRFRVVNSGRGKTIKTYIPDVLPDTLIGAAADADIGG